MQGPRRRQGSKVVQAAEEMGGCGGREGVKDEPRLPARGCGIEAPSGTGAAGEGSAVCLRAQQCSQDEGLGWRQSCYVWLSE